MFSIYLVKVKYTRVVNGQTSSGPNPRIYARTRPEPESYFEAQIMPEKARKLG